MTNPPTEAHAEVRAEPGTRRHAFLRWRRRVLVALAAYLLVVVLAHVVMSITIAVARGIGDDPRTDFYGIANFRPVDERVWAGGQPIPDAYADLAALDVRVIVDLRTGASDDRNQADPAHLAQLGIEYVRMPVPDGNVPTGAQMDRFVDLVEQADGVVFVHCGAGVGRTSALTAAYLRRTGRDAHVADHLLLGQHTLEQLWFVATGDSNVVVRGASELLDAPRRGWSRLRAAL